jgi:type IV pilus assembly protein PilY1
LSVTPNIHVGRETGSKAYIQSSTGAITTLPQLNPGRTKSGKQYWNMDESACP